mmetsp:Transcript_3926/g.4550  ORF Transcript_3926/g.4550 Transcript_3926/m.4550 type:complete len:152 (+) Transcript_3926:31-486(+)
MTLMWTSTLCMMLLATQAAADTSRNSSRLGQASGIAQEQGATAVALKEAVTFIAEQSALLAEQSASLAELKTLLVEQSELLALAGRGRVVGGGQSGRARWCGNAWGVASCSATTQEIDCGRNNLRVESGRWVRTPVGPTRGTTLMYLCVTN